MGTISSSVGIISGIDTKSLIDQLIAIESRPKTLIQRRTATLKTTQVAYQEINSTLLALKGSATGFTPRLFDATTSASSDDTVLGVSSTPSAAPGSYSFTVNRLVTGQQTVSKGFLDTNFTKIAPQGATLTFDRGEARLTSDTALSQLNGGNGIQRGYLRITDRTGNTAIVDLRAVVSVNDVIDKINQTTGVNVFAEIDGDALKITDLSGGAGNFTIADVGGNGTAASLGLAFSIADDQITGVAVNTVGRNSLLTNLNDGNGVRFRAGGADLRITTSGGGSFDIDIESAKTLGELIDLINTTTAGNVTAAVNAAGTGLSLTDTSGGGGGAGFAVTAINNSNAAADLGLLQTDADADGEIVGGRVIASINSKLLKNLNGGEGVAGLADSTQVTLLGSTSVASLFGGTGLVGDGSGDNDLKITTRNGASVEIDLDSVAGGSVQDLINLINNASPNLQASLDGQSLRITDISGGASNLIIENLNGSTAATTLGIATDAAVNQVTTGNLNPTGAASAAAVIRVTNRLGAGTDIDLAGAQTVDDILAAINAADAGVTASVNSSGTGIVLRDTTGGTGAISVSDVSGTAAASLRLAKSATAETLDSGSLQYRYLYESTRLDTLGVTRGKFKITDSSGATATVDLTQGNEITIADVISEINSRGIAVTARINDTGDGILLQDTGLGTFAIKVEEDGSTTAANLGLLGTAAAPGRSLNGTFEKSVHLTGDDTLESAVTKIVDAKVGVLAAVINDGSPGAPYRLSLQSETEGTRGAFTFDDGGLDLGVTNVNNAQDAVVFFGSADPAKALQIISKSNTIENVVPGVTVTLKRVSDIPVTVTVNRDDEGVVSAAQAFVDNFNKVVAAIDKHDSYDAETEQRGLLLGDATVATTKNRLYALITNRNTELSGQFSALSQIGIRVGKDSVLEFDPEKFRAALATDRDAVENLFTLKETEEDADGEDVITRAGIGVRIDEFLARLTDSVDGVFKRRVDTIDGQVAINDRRIEDLDRILESKRARLERQFLAMEEALANLQGQGNALNQLQQLGNQARASVTSANR